MIGLCSCFDCQNDRSKSNASTICHACSPGTWEVQIWFWEIAITFLETSDSICIEFAATLTSLVSFSFRFTTTSAQDSADAKTFSALHLIELAFVQCEVEIEVLQIPIFFSSSRFNTSESEATIHSNPLNVPSEAKKCNLHRSIPLVSWGSVTSQSK